jgi:hypothetical protein
MNKRELTMAIGVFEHTPMPAADLLLNMLQRVHDTTLPIDEAVLAF